MLGVLFNVGKIYVYVFLISLILWYIISKIIDLDFIVKKLAKDSKAKPPMSTLSVFRHNAKLDLICCILIFLGVDILVYLFLFLNAAILGIAIRYVEKIDRRNILVATIFGHGALEIFSMFLMFAGAAIKDYYIVLLGLGLSFVAAFFENNLTMKLYHWFGGEVRVDG